MKKKTIKYVLVLILIALLILPHTTSLLAASLNQDAETAELQVIHWHEGGEESSGTLTPEQLAFYDETQYQYNVGSTKVFKIIEKDDFEYSNEFYCLNAVKSMPGQNSTGSTSLTYRNSANLKDYTDTDVRALHMSVSYLDDLNAWNANYKALNWLIDNIYLEKQITSQKDAYLEKAFAGSEYDLDSVKAILSDDDIDVIQQYAIWHFTNGDDARYSVETLPTVRVEELSIDYDASVDLSKSYVDIDSTKYQDRQAMANYLYNYLITSASNNTIAEIYPTIKNTLEATAEISNGYYVAGPFEVTSGTVSSSEYDIKLLDQDNNEIPETDYNILINDMPSANKIDEIFDTPFYVQIPIDIDISSVRLALDCNKYETTATLWISDDGAYQEVALLTREKTVDHEEKLVTIVKSGSYNIELLKQDKDTKESLAGAEFDVQIGTAIAKYTTDANGIISIPNIIITEEGTDTIKITETKAPEGYKKIEGTLELEVDKLNVNLDDYEHEFIDETDDSIDLATGNMYLATEVRVKTALPNTTAELDGTTLSIVVENEKEEIAEGYYNIELVKKDKESKESLAGAEFDVQIGTAIAKYTTDENGIISIPKVAVTEEGTDLIKITETKAPDGYKKLEGTLELEVDKLKVNLDDYGHSFIDEIYDPVDLATGNMYLATEVRVKTGLPNTTAELDGVTVLVTVENEKEEVVDGYYNIKLVKQDKNSKEKLAGAEFSVQIGNGQAKTYITNANGMISIPKIEVTEEGTDLIKITETKAPDGYKNIVGTLELEVEKTKVNLRDFDHEFIDEDGETIDWNAYEMYFATEVRTKNGLSSATAELDGLDVLVTVENEKIQKYILRVEKRDTLNNMNLEDADFNIKIGAKDETLYTTNEEGIIEIPIEITRSGTDTIKITEINAPYGYIADGGTIQINVKKSKSGNDYIISDFEADKSTTDTEVYIEDNVLVVIVRNQKIQQEIPEEPEIKDGDYELEIVKVDENGNIISTSDARFMVNGKLKATENGIAKAGQVIIDKANVKSKDKYTITETVAPEGYTKFDGTIEVEVSKKISSDEEHYEVSGASLVIKDKDGNEITDGAKIQIVKENGITKIKVKVTNREKVDLSLRKFITAVSTELKFEENSERTPEVDLTELDAGTSKTAKYNHTKEAIIVNKGDYVLYTIRVYNEGNQNAYASKIVDYLPEGLEFVKEAEANNIWDYNEEEKLLTTNENYKAKLLVKHEKEKELDYQDLQVVCKVRDDIAEDTNIINIAEIAGYQYEDGTEAKDRDSIPENIDYPNNLPAYNGGKDTDTTDEYVPGQEDDDDFERIFVNAIKGKYELDIVKIDEKGATITDLVTKFDINGQEKETENGVVKFADIEINTQNVKTSDKYTIKETKAPDEYSEFKGTILVEVTKKLSEDKKKYEVDNATMKITDEKGNTYDSKDIEVIEENGTTKIVVKVVDYKKADLSLRKFISAVSSDMKFTIDTTREPKVDTTKLDNGEATTAEYEQIKTKVQVNKGDYILYTIRVYNEGNINTVASKVVDYLPEGLEFVKDSEINKIWNYDENTRTLTTNEKYTPQLLDVHEKGKELKYQDLQVVCKVSDDIKEDTDIVNIAEITEIKNEEGNTVEDRDSKPGNFDKDKNPGQEDDDDYETIFVESIKGKYELEIIKKDESGKTISSLVTKFNVNDLTKETVNGAVKIKDIEINKDNVKTVDKYTIKETEAPKGYEKFDGTIIVSVSKSLSEDGKTYEVSEVKIDAKDAEDKSYADVEKIATAEIVEENGIKKVEVKIVNTKEKEPENPDKPTNPDKPDEPKNPDNPNNPQKPTEPEKPAEQPKTEQPNQADQNQTVIYKNTPSTGDILPIVAGGAIGLVLLINIIQIIISKRKKESDK